jgi:ABC transport system ATP-binding/permease protein
VTTSVPGLDGSGIVTPFADYDQWEAARRKRAPLATRSRPSGRRTAAKSASRPLTWAEQREWEAMEAVILAAESTVASRAAAVTDPTIASNAAELAARCRALDDAQHAVERLYARWADSKLSAAERAQQDRKWSHGESNRERDCPPKCRSKG